MSPLQIEILLHYYCRADDYRRGDFSAPAVRDAITDFNIRDLLRLSSRAGSSYELSAGGRLYVDALMDVPLPHKEWVLRDKGCVRSCGEEDQADNSAQGMDARRVETQSGSTVSEASGDSPAREAGAP